MIKYDKETKWLSVDRREYYIDIKQLKSFNMTYDGRRVEFNKKNLTNSYVLDSKINYRGGIYQSKNHCLELKYSVKIHSSKKNVFGIWFIVREFIGGWSLSVHPMIDGKGNILNKDFNKYTDWQFEYLIKFIQNVFIAHREIKNNKDREEKTMNEKLIERLKSILKNENGNVEYFNKVQKMTGKEILEKYINSSKNYIKYYSHIVESMEETGKTPNDSIGTFEEIQALYKKKIAKYNNRLIELKQLL